MKAKRYYGTFELFLCQVGLATNVESHKFEGVR